MPGYCSLTLPHNIHSNIHTAKVHRNAKRVTRWDPRYTAPYTIALPKYTNAGKLYIQRVPTGISRTDHTVHSTGNISTLVARLRCRCLCTAYRCVYIGCWMTVVGSSSTRSAIVRDCELLTLTRTVARLRRIEFSSEVCTVQCWLLKKKTCLVIRQTDKKKITQHKQ